MRQKIFNSFIIIGFLCVFYIYIKTIGTYVVAREEKETDNRIASIKVADTISVEYARSIHEKEDQLIRVEGMTKGEPMVRAVHEVIPYYIPLNEIAEKIEYVYACDSMWESIADREFDELGYLPRGEKVPITIYLAEGNHILFLPEGIYNKKVWLNHELCSMHYSEQEESYYFFCITDKWWKSEQEWGVPVKVVEDAGHIGICMVRDGKRGSIWEEFTFDSLIRLGTVEVTFNPAREIEMMPVAVGENEYVDLAVREAQEILSGWNVYGEFEMYIGTFGCMPIRWYDATNCNVTGCVVGTGIEQYFDFGIVDGERNWTAYPNYYPGLADSTTYFVSEGYADILSEDIFKTIQEIGREPISFQVVEGKDYTVMEQFEERENSTEVDETDFREITVEEAGRYIERALSYSEWFGMNELGCQEGELRGLDEKKVLIIRSDQKDVLRFMPVEKNEEKKVYEIELISNRDAGQLRTSLCMEMEDNYYSKDPDILGEVTVHIEDLISYPLPEIKEDEFIKAIEDYVSAWLVQNGKHGEYRLYIGEYTAGAHSNRACISAAVSGEGEEYYVRYLIVKSPTGKYYFWPTGFGLNGSLEECAADRHYMNRLCIERTKQLERSEFAVKIP